ncbi:hypothetical protein O181_043358 [Austropuccinia psidii MF-1]|uniref:Uncharacterized protein n=1 Tax=Austropuccinia psidii MF-1 TaxID=1389203 RepID=A0A9Q3DL70_9BASI|nr:hypothetical protein [Austropuccinia psidii MF-1]
MAFGPHLLSLANYGLRPYPALIGLFGQSSTSPTPRSIPLFWGWGGPSGLPGSFGPSSHHPFDYGVFGPFRPPAASMVRGLPPISHGPCNVRPLGPFWAKSNEAKRGQGVQPPTFKARWVPSHKWTHLSQIWPPIPPVPQMAKRTPGPKLATSNPWPLAITRGHQIKLRKVSPSFRGKSSLHQCTLYQGFRNSAYMV